MTEPELALIEETLGIRLPEAYRQTMLAFPLPACAGNHDSELWDDAAELVKLNQELRAGRPHVKPWPAEYFALGTDAGGCTQALSLSEGTVFWADRCHLPPEGERGLVRDFASWAAEYVAGLRQDLEGEGVDPGGDPATARRVQEANEREGLRFDCGCMIAALLLFGAMLAWRWLS
ncbi:MAG: SMI1/KNR4 family protein [Vicinamibacteria bacterium]|nr:SMI1/KNR4 family protein [Vicinamibacteria bacterium]